eukprot:5998378-Amphidinium_carterae.1
MKVQQQWLIGSIFFTKEQYSGPNSDVICNRDPHIDAQEADCFLQQQVLAMQLLKCTSKGRWLLYPATLGNASTVTGVKRARRGKKRPFKSHTAHNVHKTARASSVEN